MTINKVYLSGNLTRDAELRRTQAGTAVVNFGMAVNERRLNRHTGEYDDYANFVDCTMWGKLAEAVSGALVKGQRVTIEGRLHMSAWERDGQKRTKIEVIVENVEGLPRKNQQGTQPQGVAQKQADFASAVYDAVYDDDIPF